MNRKHGRKDSADQISMQEAQENYSARNRLADSLVEGWDKKEAGADLVKLYTSSPSTARNTALALETQYRYLTRMDETTISTQFQTTPENVLKIVRIGSANSNRGEIFHEWPMVTTDDSIYFINKVYTSTGTIHGGFSSGDKMYENIYPNAATEVHNETIGPGDGATTTFTANPASIIPVVEFSVRVIEDGVLIGNDDGVGGISGTGLDADNSSIVYSTGVITVEYSSAPATGVVIDVEYQWNSESSTNYGEVAEVEIEVTRKRFNARPMPLGYSYSRMVELTLGTSGLGDVDDMLVRAVGDEHAMRKDYKAIQLAKRVALQNTTATFDTDYAAAGSDNDFNHAQTILSTISNMSGALFNDIKRGTLNKAIAGPKAATYLKKNRLWTTDTSQPRVGGTYKAGKLDDIDVYVCPADTSAGLLGDNQVLLTYRNPDDMGEVGLAFGVLTELVASLDFPDFYKKGRVATVEDSMVIQGKYCRLLNLTNLPS